MPAPRIYKVRSRFPSLASLGVAVEYFERFTNRKVRLHAVDVVVVNIPLRGRGIHYIDDDTFTITPGCVGIISRGQQHDIVTTKNGVEAFNLYLDLDRCALPSLNCELDNVLRMLLPMPPARPHRLSRGFLIKMDRLKRLRELLVRLNDEIRERSLGYRKVIDALLEMILVDFCRAALSSGVARIRPQEEAFPTWAEDLRTKLDKGFAAHWVLNDIATNYQISTGHLCRTFHRYTGKTVVEYLLDNRLQEAANRLRNTSDKILKIALNVGFSDLSYFSRQFKKRIGSSPSMFRRGGGGASMLDRARNG